MSLNGFLLLVAFLLPVILVLFHKGNKMSQSPIPYFAVLALVIILSYLTFARYTKSHGKGEYYKNTDYHIIQQEGFKFPKDLNQTLWLCSDSVPELAILPTNAGELKLDGKACLQYENFKMPLYVEDKNRPLDFHVININEELSMQSGEELSWSQNDSLVLTIKYEEIEKNNQINGYRFIFKLQDGVTDTVVEPVFRQGLNLGVLLQKGNNTRLDSNTRELMENCYLVREHYELDVAKPKKVSGKVYLFGDELFTQRSTFKKNGSPITINSNNKSYCMPMEMQHFFYGLGSSRSPIYKITTDENSVIVNYRLPKMYHFPKAKAYSIKTGDELGIGEANMFLTTDKQEIIDRRADFKCFYQFTEQQSDSSLYKASAVVNFIIDSAGISLNPLYADLFNSHQGSLCTIHIDEPFEVRTASCKLPLLDGDTLNPAHVSYIFRIRDMRNNEVYRYSFPFYIIMALLFLGVYLLLFVLTPNGSNRINKLYIIETSIYLVMIAFLTVRLVILWRLHTFPPIDNVSRVEIDTLTNPGSFFWTFYGIFFILIARIIILVLQWVFDEKHIFNFNEWIDKALSQYKITIMKNRVQIPFRWIIAAVFPIIVYLMCGLLGRTIGSMQVIVKEALAPILAFAINSIYYAYRLKVDPDYERDEYSKRGIFYWVAIIWNTVVFFMFLILPSSLLGFNENGMLFPMAGVFATWFLITTLIMPSTKKLFRWLMIPIILLLLVIVYCHVPLAQTPFGEKAVSWIPDQMSRPRARIVATSKTPTEMIKDNNIKFQDKSMQDILNASANKWFIDSHLAQRYYLAKGGNMFILDKDYNQRAVSYTTQTRDVVLLRYVIYEHGSGVVKKLLWILLLVTINIFVVYKRRGHQLPFLQQLPLQSSMFLLMFSIYLFLVNLNAVVFVGLDFPFLTLTSNGVPWGLLLPLFAMQLPLNIKRLNESVTDDLDYSGPDKRKIIVGAVSFILICGIVSFPLRRMEKQIKQNDGISTASFSVSMEPLAEFINDYMNPELRNHQEKTQESTQKYKQMNVYDKSLKTDLNEFVFGTSNTSAPLIDVKLADFARQTKHYGDTAFIKSAFRKFFNTSLTNTSSIIHLRKSNGLFIFVTNKVYYDMKPMFKNNKVNLWRGDLIGAARTSRLSFTGDNNDEVFELKKGFYEYGSRIDKKNADKLRNQFLGVNNQNNINFNIVQIPKEYCYLPEENAQDVFVLNPTDAPEGVEYVVYPLGDFTNPIKEKNIALRLLPNDIVEVSGAQQSFSFKTETGHYFSKRIHYNGKHQVIYPLGSQFMFAYNLDQMLAETYHPASPEEETKPIRISLDYDLLCQVDKYCDSTMGKKQDVYGDGITVTAIDGNGRIRLLADYNPRTKASLDPNQSKEIQRRMEDIYLSGNTPERRAMLQNRNVARMPIGPGSTIKVPLYVATLTGTHIDWTKVRLSFCSNCAITEGGQAVVKKFGNYKVHGIHKNYNGWDEDSSEYISGTLNANNFIATSNNFFFGSMLTLATYSPTKLRNGLGGVLVSAQPNESVFPKFQIGNSYYKFKDRFIEEFEISRALESSLENNFGFHRWLNRNDGSQSYDVSPLNSLYDCDTSMTQSAKMRTLNSEYVYSERPKLHRFVKDNNDDNEVFNEIFNITSGGAKHLDVSPLNMAEMYLRIALQNSAENILTYSDESENIPYSPFKTINDSLKTQMQKTTYLGMWDVINNASSGTLRNATDRELQQEWSRKSDPIYIYGKTGTVGDKTVQTHDNLHYAFILSNKRLDSATNLDGLKVYVVYFGFYDSSLGKHSKTAKIRKDILNKIIESETFRNYWEDKAPTTH